MEPTTLPYQKAYLEIRFDKYKCNPGNKNCGSACVSNKKKCRNNGKTSKLRELKLSNSSSTENASIQEKVVYYHESKIRNLPYEQAVAVDVNGKVVVNAKGGEDYVSFTRQEVQAMMGKDVILTHNHPTPKGYPPEHPVSKGIGFSDADCAFACGIQAKEIRAVTRDYNHSLKPPENDWDQNFWDRKVEPAYRKSERQVYRELMVKIYTNRISPEQASADYAHLVMQYTAEKTGMKYTREEIKNGH